MMKLPLIYNASTKYTKNTYEKGTFLAKGTNIFEKSQRDQTLFNGTYVSPLLQTAIEKITFMMSDVTVHKVPTKVFHAENRSTSYVILQGLDLSVIHLLYFLKICRQHRRPEKRDMIEIVKMHQ